MDKITKEHLEILANIGKKKDIQAFIVKNYFKMLDLNNIIKEYLHFRGLYEVERKPRIKKIDTDLINRIKENEDMIMRRDELNKREGFERGFKSGYEAYTVVFSSCDFTVVKRGLQPHWSVSLSLDEV